MIAGRLEIELMANVARLSQDMAQAKNLIGNATRDIERMASVARTALGAIGVGLSVAGIAALTKHTIDAMAKMKDLAQEAGTTAEAISRFDEPARKAGSSVEAVAGSIFKVSKAMLEARDPTSNAAQALRSIGLSAEQLKGLKSDEMFEKIARSVAQYSDGVEKNAVMQELFGKSGREMSRVVAEIAEKTQLAATVTNEDAEAADRLGDQMVELRMHSEKLWRSIAADGLPVLNEMLKVFIEGKKEAGLLQGAINAMAVAFEQIGGGPERQRIAALKDDIASLQKLVMSGPGLLERMLGIDNEPALRARIEKLKKEMQGLMAIGDARPAGVGSGPAAGNKPPPQFDPEAFRKALAEKERLQKLDAAGWVAYIDAQKKEYEDGLLEMAKLTDDFYKNKERLQKLDDAGWVKKIDHDIEEYERGLKAAADLVPSNIQRVQSQMLSIWNELGDRGAMFFQDLAFSGEKAFDVLKRHLKAFLAELIAVFAKKWILQLGAMMPGMGALGTAAASVGEGTLAGSLAGGAFSAGSSFVAGWQGATLGAGMAGPTTAGAGGFMGAGSMLATMGPVGWAAIAVLAIAAVATIFRDKGENWRATLGFGDNAQVYRTQGVFGAEGFQQIAGDDALNRQIQAFMVSTGAVDRIIAARLSQSQMDTIRANLGGAYTTRADGQPAEFAFGRGDDNAGQALTLEYLQKKYGTIFDQIDTTFADFIRSYSGKSEDLFKEIAAFVGMMESLAGTGIKGFDVAALRAMQHEGETLAQTFERVGGQWSTFNDLFTTEAERMTAAQAAINTTFADLGIAVPDSMAAFKDLVNGLDLSTESGRKFFEALMLIAPTFAQVSNAITAQVASIRSIINSITGNSGASSLSSLINQFQAGNSWSSSLSDASLISALLTITDADLANYSQAHRDLIGSILSAHQAMQNLGSSTSSAAAGLSAMGDGFNTTGDKSGLRDWVNRQIFNPATTTLTIDQRFAEAQRQYEDLAKLAKLGNPEAISKLQGAADTYLELARLMFGSSGNYNAIFAQVLSEVGKVGGMSQADVNARLYSALPTTSPIASSADISSLKEAVYDLIMQVANGSDSQAKATREGSRTITEEVRQTANTGRLA